MNRNTINFIITLTLAIILSIFLPWWSVMVAALISSLIIPLKHIAVFAIPFIAIFIFWGIYSFILSNNNDFIMAKRIATLLPLGGNPYTLILLTGIIGGLASGVSAIFGKQLSLALKKQS